ncbi:hypothetical protein K469DRAFT_361864 [Zopfia rhizophila CBS 207.26]|uniref:Secreted protein n=1 Tax=Zopfia rhizophila CBS 207.26 TaxID=1314779 RepID=A0A6A6EJZ5_9PEZI|nr:hypothetical protein K469DRAFT_361864 [Zopfia rhizophila CBS 207.26]
MTLLMMALAWFAGSGVVPVLSCCSFRPSRRERTDIQCCPGGQQWSNGSSLAIVGLKSLEDGMFSLVVYHWLPSSELKFIYTIFSASLFNLSNPKYSAFSRTYP